MATRGDNRFNDVPLYIRPDHPDWPGTLDPQRKLRTIEGDKAIIERMRMYQK